MALAAAMSDIASQSCVCGGETQTNRIMSRIQVPTLVIHGLPKRFCVCLYESLTFCSWKDDVSDNQMQNLIGQPDEVLQKLSSQPAWHYRLSITKLAMVREGSLWEGTWWNFGHWNSQFWWILSTCVSGFLAPMAAKIQQPFSWVKCLRVQWHVAWTDLF